MARRWQCGDCLTFNDDPQSSCMACGGSSRRLDTPPPWMPPPVSTPADTSWPTTTPAISADPGWPPRDATPIGTPAGVDYRGSTAPPPREYYVPAKPPPSRGAQRMLIIAVVIVGVLIAVTLVVADQSIGRNTAQGSSGSGGSGQNGTGGRGSGRGDASAASQAQRVDALLTDSIAGRKHLLTAIDKAMACDKADAITEIQAAASARQTVLDQARASDLSALPSGADLKTALVTLLGDSYSADQAYLDWVEATDGDCPSTSASSFDAVQSANNRASQDKATFLADWNPVAVQFGLPTRDATTI